MANTMIRALPPAVFENARKVEAKKNSKGFTAFVEQAADVLGISEADFVKLYNEQKGAHEMREMRERRDQALDEMKAAVAGIKLPKGIQNVTAKMAKMEKDFDIQVFIVIDSEGNVSARISGARAGRNAKGPEEMSEKSRISSWEALQKGIAAGDSIEVEKLGRREYRDSEGYEFKNLTAYIKEFYPESHTANILRKYGQIRD